MAHLALTGQVAPRAILAVTHSTQAAGELRDRIWSLGVAVQARTFHSAASRQLRHFWSKTGLPGDELILVEKSEQNYLLRGALSAVSGSVATTDVTDLRSEIQWAKRRRLTPAEYPAAARASGRTRALPPDTLAGAFARYEKAKRHIEKLDFDDIPGHRSFAGAFAGSLAWPARQCQVVGDPSQTIYSFEGADPSLLAGFAARHPGALSISLKKDYRSTPQIVAAANRLMAHSSACVVLEGQRPDGPEPVRVRYDGETDERDGVVERVGELFGDGVPASEIAVLLRTNFQVSSFRLALTEAGIPTEVFDDDKYFERPKIRKVIRTLE